MASTGYTNLCFTLGVKVKFVKCSKFVYITYKTYVYTYVFCMSLVHF